MKQNTPAQKGTMDPSRSADNRVFGIEAAAPRLTATGVWLLLRYLGGPLLATLLLLDTAAYVIARFVFERCYGVLCLL